MLFITAYINEPHGSAKSASDFVKAILSNNQHLDIICPKHLDRNLFDEGQRFLKFKQFRVPYKRRRKPKQPILNCIRKIQDAYFKTFFSNRFSNKNVVVNGWSSYSYWKYLKILNVKSTTIIIRESPRHFSFSDKENILPSLIASFQEFDKLIFVSKNVMNEWLSYRELSSKPFFLLPNCCEEEKIEQIKKFSKTQLREKLSLQFDDFIVLCIGTIEVRKGQDLLIDIVPQLVERFPSLKVIILGDAGSSWGENLIKTIKLHPLKGNIIHIPAQPSALEYISASDVLVVPSRAEALPRTILEGMASGKPIIAAKVDGIPELIENKKNGLLFSSNSPKELLNCLNTVTSNYKDSQMFGKFAEKQYTEHFSRRNQIEKAKELIKWIKL